MSQVGDAPGVAGAAAGAATAGAVVAGKGKKPVGIYKNLRSRKTPPGSSRKRGAAGSPEAKRGEASKRRAVSSEATTDNDNDRESERDGSAGPAGYEIDPVDEDDHEEEVERGMSEDGSEPRLGLAQGAHVRYPDEAVIAARLEQTLELDVLKEKVACAHSSPSRSLSWPLLFRACACVVSTMISWWASASEVGCVCLCKLRCALAFTVTLVSSRSIFVCRHVTSTTNTNTHQPLPSSSCGGWWVNASPLRGFLSLEASLHVGGGWPHLPLFRAVCLVWRCGGYVCGVRFITAGPRRHVHLIAHATTRVLTTAPLASLPCYVLLHCAHVAKA
jgi:hypothetical protein